MNRRGIVYRFARKEGVRSHIYMIYLSAALEGAARRERTRNWARPRGWMKRMRCQEIEREENKRLSRGRLS